MYPVTYTQLFTLTILCDEFGGDLTCNKIAAKAGGSRAPTMA